MFDTGFDLGSGLGGGTFDLGSYDAGLSGSFMQPNQFDFSNLSSPSFDNSYLNFGLTDPYNQYAGQMPTFATSNESPFSGLGSSYEEDPWYKSLLDNVDLGGIASLGLGALGKYGDYLGTKRMQESAQKAAMERARLEAELQREQRQLTGGDDFAKLRMMSQILQDRQGINSNESLAYADAVRRQLGISPDNAAKFEGIDIGGPIATGINAQDRLSMFNSPVPSSYSTQFANGGMFNMGALNSFPGMHNDDMSRLVNSGRAEGGQDDVFNAQLTDGEYVMDADVVAALGDGNTEAGAAELDRMREAIRQHKRSAPNSSIPPKSRGALAYLKGK